MQPDGEPGTELIVHHARGLLGLAEHRNELALGAFRAAERMQALLAEEHALATEIRARVLQAQIGHRRDRGRARGARPLSATRNVTGRRCALPPPSFIWRRVSPKMRSRRSRR